MSVKPFEADFVSLRAIFGAFPSGVAALSANVGGDSVVLVASSFTVGVSMDPPMVMFAVQNSSSTWPVLAAASHIGVSILAASHASVVRQLASKDKESRFAGIDTVLLESGAILIAESPVWLECKIAHDYPAGDHRIIVLQVTGTNAMPSSEPLIWHNSIFRELVA